MKVEFTHTRYSIPTALKENGVEYAATEVGGALRYIINGETLTPGEAIDRYDALGLHEWSAK